MLTSLIKYGLDITSMEVYTCKKCGEPNFLTPITFWNISTLVLSVVIVTRLIG
jgi:hypothetical protein